MILVIVESPAKCKKIESFLGPGYKVIASFGHICKLSSLDQINFDTFDVKFKNEKHKVIKQLKEETKRASKVILATDDDREGEAISWHICNVCKLPFDKTEKITFQEITKPAILNSLKNPRHIDMNRVESQFTRQILDIVVGFKISPLLWKYVQSKISAGRCQTPALKLVYENEKLFENQNLDTQYTIKGYFTSKNIEFTLNTKIEKDIVEEFVSSHKNQKYICESPKETTKTLKPPRPFITSTLQQRSSSILKMSPKITMKCAQTLYESGLITYMRTDSMCYSKDFISKGKKYIEEKYGDDFVSNNINTLSYGKTSTKTKTQDAHEGIRITDLDKETNMLSSKMDNSCKRLYELIRNNTIQSMMSNALFKVYTFMVNHMYDNKNYKYEKSFDICTFTGWKILEKCDFDIENQKIMKVIDYIKNLKNNIIPLYRINADEKLKETNSHYNEASLISQLEKMNIGRPSTYASIMDSLISKKYVTKGNIEGVKINSTNYIYDVIHDDINKKESITEMNAEKSKLKISILGKQVIEFIYEYCPALFQYDFTNDMEIKLDDISKGTISKVDALTEYMNIIETNIKETKSYLKDNSEKIPKVKKENSINCGEYKGHDIIIRHGPYGYYLSHNKKNKSLNGIQMNIESLVQSQECNSETKDKLISYLEQEQNKSLILELNNDLSIRNGKYGKYIFHKTKSMKKPKFYKYDDKNDNLNNWLLTQDKEHIIEYIKTKYKL